MSMLTNKITSRKCSLIHLEVEGIFYLIYLNVNHVWNIHINAPIIVSSMIKYSRYMNFLQGLGAYVRLRDIQGVSVYSGGLDTKYGEDGDFSIAWHDDVMQVHR